MSNHIPGTSRGLVLPVSTSSGYSSTSPAQLPLTTANLPTPSHSHYHHSYVSYPPSSHNITAPFHFPQAPYPPSNPHSLSRSQHQPQAHHQHLPHQQPQAHQQQQPPPLPLPSSLPHPIRHIPTTANCLSPGNKRKADSQDISSNESTPTNFSNTHSADHSSVVAVNSTAGSTPPVSVGPVRTQLPLHPAPKKGRTNRPWTPGEELRLRKLRDEGKCWSEIAKAFPLRTEGSVKKHWYKDMHYAEFGDDESTALLQAIKEYESNKWKNIGAKVGKPAKACEAFAKEQGWK